MNRIFSNGPSKDFVINPFKRLLGGASRVWLAAPYFTIADPIVDAAKAGKLIQLLVGLNESTSPQALAAVHKVPNLAVRYLTRRFHAKIYIFDDAAMVGSSNLTDGGLFSNREAIICLDETRDRDAVEEVRGVFLELWVSAQVLTPEKLNAFRQAYMSIERPPLNGDAVIENAVGRAEPVNIDVGSRTRTRERIFLEGLRREVYEQYRPAFSEVTRLLEEHGFRRPELQSIGIANETNRFLNWVRRTYVIGDEAWQTAPFRPQGARRSDILRLGAEWASTSDSKVPEDYVSWLQAVEEVFGTDESIASASKDDITRGLISLHAFSEQLRFVKGGLANLPPVFWAANQEDVERMKKSLTYLIHGSGDFIQRLHDLLYDPSLKLRYFGYFCALELYGTIKPEECPPMNGRMAKALRYLGFDVRGN
jgi:hypothetical protein